MGKILLKYYEKTQSWGDGLVSFAQRLFYWFLLADVLLFAFNGGIGIATGGKNLANILGEFVLLVCLPAAFMYAVLNHYQEWSQQIVNGFSYIAGQIEPKSNIGATNFFVAGLDLFERIFTNVSLGSPSTWALLLAGFVLLIVYALIACQILLVKCESYIVLSAGIIILGFGAFAQTRQYALNFIRYVLSVAIKLYVMQLIIGLAFSFVEDFLETPIKSNDLAVVIGASIVMLALIRCIPDMCAGIIQGQHVGSGNALSGTLAAVGGAAMGALGGSWGAVKTGTALGSGVMAASQTAGVEGKTGLGKLGSVAGQSMKAAWQSAQGDPGRSFTGRFNSMLKAKLEAAKMDADLKK